MIHIREIAKEQGKLLWLLNTSDFLWDELTDIPDYYCSGIEDFKTNYKNIRDKRLVEFKSLEFNSLNYNGKFQLQDSTGKLEAQLLIDFYKIESFFDKLDSNSTRELLNTLNSGDTIYQINLKKIKNDIYVTSFNTKSHKEKNLTAKNYLNIRFPQIDFAFSN